MSGRKVENKRVVRQSVKKKVTERQSQIQEQKHSEDLRKSRYKSLWEDLGFMTASVSKADVKRDSDVAITNEESV